MRNVLRTWKSAKETRIEQGAVLAAPVEAEKNPAGHWVQMEPPAGGHRAARPDADIVVLRLLCAHHQASPTKREVPDTDIDRFPSLDFPLNFA